MMTSGECFTLRTSKNLH